MALRDRNKTGGNSLVTTVSNLDTKGSLRRVATGAIARPTGKGLAAVKKAAVRTPVSGHGNVGFVFDATYSRQHVWNKAQQAFQQMFRSMRQKNAMQIRFMDFGDPGDIVDREWTSDVEQLCEAVSKVKCRGGITQINDCLRQFVNDGNPEMPDSIVYIGDHYEETEEELERTIQIMRQNKVKIFTFLDSEDKYAEETYRRLAEQTGGNFVKFGDDMPLEDLCEGVALLTTGGVSALSRLNNLAARNLLLAGPKR